MAVKKKGKLSGGGDSPAKRNVNLLYSANQIWMAGLGAMARAQSEGSKVFDDLVSEGSQLQGSALETAQKVFAQALQGAQKHVTRKVDDVRGQATETWDSLEKIFQSRVQRALHQLGMPTADEISALTHKVEDLARAVDQLAQAGRPARKTAARKKAARKKAARKPRARKTTAVDTA